MPSCLQMVKLLNLFSGITQLRLHLWWKKPGIHPWEILNTSSYIRNLIHCVSPHFFTLRYPYFGLLPVHLQLQLEADGAKMCSFSANSEWGSETTHSSSLVIDRNLVTAVADTSTKLVTLTILMLCRAEDRGPSAL